MKKIIFVSLIILCSIGYAQLTRVEGGGRFSSSDQIFWINNTWLLLCSMFVFLMHPGFTMLEAGFIRAKNTVSIIYKNIVVLTVGITCFALFGYSFFFNDGDWIIRGFLGFDKIGVESPPGPKGLFDFARGGYSFWSSFVYNALLAVTSLSIVSGSVSERIKRSTFFIFCIIFSSFIYPVLGSWVFTGGWLANMSFFDFAGASYVHITGGAAALSGAILLGPRFGKYDNFSKKVKTIPGDNVPLVALGLFFLTIGWVGFNGGSVGTANPADISYVFFATIFSFVIGTLTSIVLLPFWLKKSSFTYMIVGSLGGLVSCTAGANLLSPLFIALTAAIGSIVACLVTYTLDNFAKVDDPVFAVGPHLGGGFWGILAVGLFAEGENFSFLTQLTGALSYALAAFVLSSIAFYIMKVSMGIRVKLEEELIGMDLIDHGENAYHGFQFFYDD